MTIEPLELPDNVPACHVVLRQRYEVMIRLEQRVAEKERELAAKRRRLRQLRTRLARKCRDAWRQPSRQEAES